MEDGPVAFEQIIVAMKSEDELLLAFMDGALPGKPGEHRCVALLQCSREMAEIVMRAIGSALNEK